MIIKRADIEGFGKFSNKSIEFSPGFNLINGKNEDGKTTFMSFVKMMFYSSCSKSEGGQAQDLFKSLRKRYRPWDGSPMAGSVEFECKGIHWRLQKQFLKSAASDKTKIYSVTYGEETKIENPNEAGEFFFDMNLGEFERSIFIGQTGGFSSEASGDSLAMRIANLSVSGDESVSHEIITKRLNDAIEELVSKRETKGALVEARERLSSLTLKLQQLRLEEDSQKALYERIETVEKEIAEAEKKLKSISDIKNREFAQKELSAYYNLSNRLSRLAAIDAKIAEYGLDNKQLKSTLAQADELEKEISSCIDEIERLSTLSDDAPLSMEEFSALQKTSEEVLNLKADADKLETKIAGLYDLWTSAQNLAKRHAKRASVIVFAVAAAFAAVFCAAGATCSSILYFIFGALCLAVGLPLFAVLNKTLPKTALDSADVQFKKRDYESAIRSLSAYYDTMEALTPQEILAKIKERIFQKEATLNQVLEKYGCTNVSQLKNLTQSSKTELLHNSSLRLNSCRERFIALMGEISPKSSYPAAKGLYLEIVDILNTRRETAESIETICSAAGIKEYSADSISNKISELAKIVDSASAVSSTDTDSHTLELQLVALRRRLGEYQQQIQLPEKSESELNAEILEAQEVVSRLQNRYDELKIAAQVMAEAISETNRGLGLHLSKKTAEYLSAMTNGRYSEVSVSRDLNVEAKTNSAEAYREWKYFSSGAIDRIYLALRLAATDIISKNSEVLPLFLDDILSQYDDDSCKSTLLFLKNYLSGSNSSSQILFFTCHSHIARMAKDIFEEYNEITL